MAAANPAIIIPIIIKAVVEFNLAEKNTIIDKAIKAPKNEEITSIQELFIKEVNPKTEDKNITKATPNPEAEVIPSTEGSASGFLNNSCNNKPLTGNEIPAKSAAKVLGKR